MMQFPWMMYSKDADQGSILPLPRGESVRCKAAADEAEFKAALEAGWFPSVPEALNEEPNAVTREAMAEIERGDVIRCQDEADFLAKLKADDPVTATAAEALVEAKPSLAEVVAEALAPDSDEAEPASESAPKQPEAAEPPKPRTRKPRQ